MNKASLTSACLIAATLLHSPLLADDESTAADAESVWVTSIAALGNSSDFVAATADGLLLREAAVVSFPAANPTALTTLYTHPSAVWCVDATNDGQRIASVDYRGNLVVFDRGASEPKTHEQAFERWCQAMMITPDDQAIVAGNEAGKIMVWNFEAAKVTSSAELDGHAVTGLALSPDQTQLAASDGAGHVHLLKWPELEPIAEIKISDETAWCVAFTNDGSQLLVGSSDRHLYRCDAKADAKPESVARGTDWITELAVSPGGQIAAAELGGKLHFPSSGGTDSMEAESGVWALCWNSDQQLFAGTRKHGIAMAGRSWKWTEPAPPPAEQPKDEPETAAEEKPAEEPKAESDVEKKDDQPKAEPKADEKADPADDKPADEKPADDKPADEKPADDKPADEKPADEKPADEKHDAGKQQDE